MLDATDGTTGSTIAAGRRVRVRGSEPQKAGTGACKGATPRITVRTRDTEHTGRRGTVARSRIKSNYSINYKVSDNLIGHIL
jgi:hypothetical protein